MQLEKQQKAMEILGENFDKIYQKRKNRMDKLLQKIDKLQEDFDNDVNKYFTGSCFITFRSE